jgi:hypothetical protein
VIPPTTPARGAELRTIQDYRQLPLLCLLERIATAGDQAALRELHDHRTLFRHRDSGPLLLAQFVDRLRSSSLAHRLAGSDTAVRDRAYDLTIDKFTRMPTGREPGDRRGPDCRRYYRFCLARIARSRQGAPLAGDRLESEKEAACGLQGYVVWQFRRSCLEARRSANPALCRVAWTVGRGVVHLHMPRSMPPGQRRAWLQAHVDDPDPARPGERHRIQAIVDRHLLMPAFLPLQQVPHLHGSPAQTSADFGDLAEVVADEKARNVQHQRPAIRALGPSVLACMIRQIFADLGDGRYQAEGLARSFGLSKPTFSRFAGSRWAGRGTHPIPDLWANTARVLATHPAFAQAARETALWPRIEHAARQAAPR